MAGLNQRSRFPDYVALPRAGVLDFASPEFADTEALYRVHYPDQTVSLVAIQPDDDPGAKVMQEIGQRIKDRVPMGDIILDSHGTDKGLLLNGQDNSRTLGVDQLIDHLLELKKENGGKVFANRIIFSACDIFAAMDESAIDKLVAAQKKLGIPIIASASVSFGVTGNKHESIAAGDFYKIEDGKITLYMPFRRNHELVELGKEITASSGEETAPVIAARAKVDTLCSTIENAACTTAKQQYDNIKQLQNTAIWLITHRDAPDAEKLQQAQKFNGLISSMPELYHPDLYALTAKFAPAGSEAQKQAVEKALALVSGNFQRRNQDDKGNIVPFEAGAYVSDLIERVGQPQILEQITKTLASYKAPLNDNQDNILSEMQKRVADPAFIAAHGKEGETFKTAVEKITERLAQQDNTPADSKPKADDTKKPDDQTKPKNQKPAPAP